MEGFIDVTNLCISMATTLVGFFLAFISPDGNETYIIHNIEKKTNLRYHAVIHFPKIFQKPLSRHAICCRFIFPP